MHLLPGKSSKHQALEAHESKRKPRLQSGCGAEVRDSRGDWRFADHLDLLWLPSAALSSR